MPSFDEWLKRATENDPFPYQRRFVVKTKRKGPYLAVTRE
jgi:hypothetical protein